LDFRLFTCTFFRLFKLPERWLLPMFALRGKVAIPADFEGPSDSGGAGSGSSAATPAAILVQSAAAPTDGNGSDRRRDKHSRKRLPDGNGRPKPR
jgi:hypothetical protein